MHKEDFLTLFDGICDQTKELETLSGSMSNDVKWIISSTERYMFVRFGVDRWSSSPGFLAKIHYGNEILNNKVTVSILTHQSLGEFLFLLFFFLLPPFAY